MEKRPNLQAIIAMLLSVTLLAGCLSGCSLFEKKKKYKESSDSDPEITWPFENTQDKQEDTKPDVDDAVVDTTEPTEPAEEDTQTVTEATEPTTEPTEPTTTAHRQYFPDEIIHPMTGTGEITASVLNIREYPGRDYEILGGLERGTWVLIYDQVLVDGEYWGEIDQGWINMQWVAMDGDVVGTWYQYQGVDAFTGDDLYGFWTLDLTGDFSYVVYSFGADEVRQVSRSGGSFQMDEYRISFDFIFGREDVTLAGITTSMPGNITCYWNVYGKTMTLKDATESVLTRGTVEKLWEQLQEGD